MLIFLVFLICIGEGLGLHFFHAYLPYGIALIPGIIYIYHIIRYNSFYITLNPTIIIYGVATGLYAVSIFFSLNKEASVEPILVFTSVYLLYMYFNSYPISDSRIKKMIFGLCGIFIIGFLGYVFQNKINLPWVNPQTSYQLITPYYYPHNHLGDFLGLGIIVSLYCLIITSKIRYIIPILIFLPFILISFSNSAYLSLVSTSGILLIFALKKYHKIIYKLLFVFFILLISISVFFIGSTKTTKNRQSSNMLQKIVIKTFSFYPKTLGSNRFAYYSQALQGMVTYPLTGVGPNNFKELSRQFKTSSDDFTTDAHNIFLELGAESGIIVMFLFISMIALRLKKGFIHPSLSFFLFLYLLINFQTDYTYKIYSVFILFMFFASQMRDQNQKKNHPLGAFIFIIGAFFLQLVIICILTSLIFQKIGEPAQAVRFNPFNRTAYYELINQAVAQNNKDKVDTYADKLHAISDVNTESELILADAYEAIGEPQKQFKRLQKAYKLQPLLSISHIESLFKLSTYYQSSQKAEQLINSYIINRKKSIFFIPDEQSLTELMDLCARTYKEGCEKLSD